MKKKILSALFEALGTEIYSTVNGDVYVKSDGKDIIVNQ